MKLIFSTYYLKGHLASPLMRGVEKGENNTCAKFLCLEKLLEVKVIFMWARRCVIRLFHNIPPSGRKDFPNQNASNKVIFQ